MKIEYAEQIIAFIDVLGFSALVDQDDHENLNRYFEATDWRIGQLKSFTPELKSLQISDSIILAVPPNQASLKSLIESVSHLQFALFDIGLPTRGAITIGELNSDIESGRIVGKGFIRAYELEKRAKFPRVLIDPMILQRFDWTRQKFLELYNHDDALQAIHHLPHSGGLLENDELFVSYLAYTFWNAVKCHKGDGTKNPYQSKIDMYYSILRSNIYKDFSHAPKYRWIRDYILEILMTIEIKLSIDGKPHNDARSPRKGSLPGHPVISPTYDRFLEL